MRKNLFEALKAKITADVPEVQHIDLWNRNVEFIEQEDNWARPAVFVEFGTIDWSPFIGGRLRRGSSTLLLHLVTDWNEDGYATAFDLSSRLHRALEGLEGQYFGPLALTQTMTSHDHEELLESIDVYAVKYLEDLDDITPEESEEDDEDNEPNE